MRHDAIMALARLRWPVDDETRIVTASRDKIVLYETYPPHEYEEMVMAHVTPDVRMCYEPHANALVIDSGAIN